MKTLLISDTHFNHGNIQTYCQRPENFTELLIRNWNLRVNSGDVVIHLGDVAIGRDGDTRAVVAQLKGRKILIRGNHDRHHSCSWWMDNGFEFACDAMMYRNWWLTHEPAVRLPWTEGPTCQGNVHGHLHNIWDGFGVNHLDGADRLRRELQNPWQRLFAVEYTNYYPIEFTEFVDHPDKYFARGK